MVDTDDRPAQGHSEPKTAGERRSLRDILDAALHFEQAAQRYFEDLRWRVDKPLRTLVSHLADEEARHYHLFRDLADREHAHDHLSDLVAVPASDERFSSYIGTPALGETPDDQAILRFALGREQAALDQYTALAETAPVGPIRDLFRFLAEEERRHKDELENLARQTASEG